MSACPCTVAARLAEFSDRLNEVRPADRGDMEEALVEINRLVTLLATGRKVDILPRNPVTNLLGSIKLLQGCDPFEDEYDQRTLNGIAASVADLFLALDGELEGPTSWGCVC